MKKTFFVALCMQVFFCINCISQLPYYDAFFLKAQLAPQNFTGSIPLNNAIKELLTKYYGQLPDFPDPESIHRFFARNPYFRKSDDPTKSIFANAAALSPVAFSNVLNEVGNLNVTTLADGFAKFLVERTKEELSANFFEKFRERINSPIYTDAKILFPQTASILNAIGDEVYQYQTYLGALQSSFEADLRGLLDNLPRIIIDGRYSRFFAAKPTVKSVALSAIAISNELADKKHPGKIIADFDTELLNGFVRAGRNEVKSSFQVLQLFSESLRSKGGETYWVNRDSAALLLRDTIALRIYLGLLYQQGTTSSMQVNRVSFTDYLETNVRPGSLTNIHNYITGFIRTADALNTDIKKLTAADQSKLTFADFFSFYNRALNVLEYAGRVNTLPGLAGINLGDNYDHLISTARSAGRIALNTSTRKYSAAIVDVYNVYSIAFPDTLQAVKAFLLKYGSFIAAVSQAETSDEVKKAVHAAALPSGSSRVKRETRFNVSLNAYTGLFVGHEDLRDVKDKRVINTYGVTAPIGVALSRGHSFFFLGTGEDGWRNNKKGWSSSLFISLIDLGVITAYRFEHPSTAEVPDIQLKHIFSPGVFLSTGIPKSPLSINIGAQSGPTLRDVFTDNPAVPKENSRNKTYWRYSLSICVDIPLLNFYTRN